MALTLGGKIYGLLFKRSSTYFLTLVTGVFVFERFSDGLSDSVFDSINRGKQWKDIKHLYVKSAEAESE
jgi:ubiquinol-cytochrome c reductase subunit 9